jgi:thioredoxin-dependent peroxiredoxin
MTQLKEGAKAPAFSLLSSTGEKISLSDYRGKKNVVLYFYPKDDTPGCTKEACDFKDQRKKFSAQDAEIFGVSFDSLDTHKKFIRKYGLTFSLLVDDQKLVAKKYGVYKKKSLYGRSYMGIERTTFVIDQNQKIRKIFPKVRVDGHVTDVLSTLESL